MAWCYYRDLRRKVGSILRASQLPDYVVKHLPRGHTLDYVIVAGRQKGSATLQLWSHRPGNLGRVSRFTVISFTAAEDLDWVIERP